MDAAVVIRAARQGAGLTLRALGERAGTSHSTLAAYEARTKTPNTDTLDRVVRAAGYALDARLPRRIRHDPRTGLARGDELVAVLDLAEAFPARHARHLEAPVFAFAP